MMIHLASVSDGWVERCDVIAGCFERLLGDLSKWHEATPVYTRSLLLLQLLGRPTAAVQEEFPRAIQCYWSKFCFSHSLLLAETLRPQHLQQIRDIASHLTFVGPAPRYLVAELLGDGDNKAKQAESWQFLAKLNEALKGRLGVAHWLYTLQVVPCTMHRAGCILQGGSPLLSFRSGRVSKYRSNLEFTLKL